MSIFLLIYDRKDQRVLELREFHEDDRQKAEQARHEAQREAIHRHLDREIVLFQSPSEETLRRTHGSYFLSARELVEGLETAEAS